MITTLSSPSTCHPFTGTISILHATSPPHHSIAQLSKQKLKPKPNHNLDLICCFKSSLHLFKVLFVAMKALSASSLTPLSVLSRKTSPRKVLSNPTSIFPSLKNTPSTKLHGGLVLLSSILTTNLAKALTYEEALQQSVTVPTEFDANGVIDSVISFATEFDANGVIDSVISFANENPLVVAGGVSVLAVPLIVSQVFKEQKPWGVQSARKAYTVIGENGNAQLLDIRPSAELRKVGTPDLSGLRKKAVSVVYKAEDKPGFFKRLSLKFRESENTTLFILDKLDGNSELVAELVTVKGFKAAYAIKDGAEGPRGWIKSGLPWSKPKKAYLDLSSLTDSISGAIGEGDDLLPVALGLAAATGIGLFAFTEVETILQLLGSAALVQLVGKKLLFTEDRKKTLKQVDEFLNTKIAPKELVDDLKLIGKAILPTTTTSNALPAPQETGSDTGVTNSPVQVAPQIDSVPASEVKAESFPASRGAQSPYPVYPDFKPPTSPTPSQP